MILNETEFNELNNVLLKHGKELKKINYNIKEDRNEYYEVREIPKEPVIKRSGDTWVARYDWVDYLYIAADASRLGSHAIEFIFNNNFISDSVSQEKKAIRSCLFRPIPEIEITDEIAKLRPSVKHCLSRELGFLHGVNGIHASVYGLGECRFFNVEINNFRLATVADLEDL